MSSSQIQLPCPVHFIAVHCSFGETLPRTWRGWWSWWSWWSSSLAGWVWVRLWGWVSEGCQPCQARQASHPPLPLNCTFFSRVGRDDRPDCNSRVTVSLCRWRFQAVSLPEKTNKYPADISIVVRLKIIPQHVDGSCCVHVGVYVRVCHLTFAIRRGYILLASSGWEPWGTPGVSPPTLQMR